VRALFIGALGLTLIGCSHPLPPQPDVVLCAGPNGAACVEQRAAGQPAQPIWVKAPSAITSSKAAPAAKRAKPLQLLASVKARLASRLAATTAKPAMTAAKVTSASRVPLPRSVPRPAVGAVLAQAGATEAPPAEAKAAAPETRPIQEQVVVAAAAAERMTVAPMPQPKANGKERPDRADTARHGDTERSMPAAPDNTDLLVAVLLARPDVKSVSDLTGKTIAIDDRYAKSGATVRTAIVAAGAPEVQLSEGSTTAINRLTNGEVPAAVVALVSPDAAETFPDIAGYKIFHVPLSPRAARAR